MSDPAKWKVANKYAAMLMIIHMGILLLFCILFELLNFDANIIMIGPLILSFILIFYLTERKLKRDFQ